jgi:hypothetical protein
VLSAIASPSSSIRTWRELRRMSTRWNGSRGWPTIRSSSSYQASNAWKSSSTYAARSGSAGRNAARSRVTSPARSVSSAPGQECTVNGIPGCRISGGDSSAASSTRVGSSSARTSAAGTANVGEMRRGSHTSRARVLSTTVSSPIVARRRFSVGS